MSPLTMAASSDLVMSPVFVNHPRPKVILAEAGIAARHQIGVDKILFDADYPHSDTT